MTAYETAVPFEEMTLGRGSQEPKDATEPLLRRLAESLAESLLNTFRKWQETEGARVLEAMGRRQEDWLAATAERVTEVGRRVDDLAKAAAQQSTARTETQAAISALREEVREWTGSTSDRVEALVSRMGLLQEEVTAVQAELPSRVQSLTERLDRQAEAIRGVREARTQAEGVVDQLVSALQRLQPAGGLDRTLEL
jgi:chromosome segregation ATPase